MALLMADGGQTDTLPAQPLAPNPKSLTWVHFSFLRVSSRFELDPTSSAFERTNLKYTP